MAAKYMPSFFGSRMVSGAEHAKDYQQQEKIGFKYFNNNGTKAGFTSSQFVTEQPRIGNR
jgi:hypothetical protein